MGEALIKPVTRAAEALIRAGDEYHGLFPSLIDRSTLRMLDELPPEIPGQRRCDRAHRGSNLIHDEAALKTLYALSAYTGNPDYRAAADRYLERFAKHCTATASGLFPWGEHSYWDLDRDWAGSGYALRSLDEYARSQAPPSATHDHLRQAPAWLWEKLYSFNPGAVERFAEGLDWHWTEGGPPEEYNRHAPVTERKRARRRETANDFPRHSGFYIFDWAFALRVTGRAIFKEWIERAIAHWWEKRDSRGLLLIKSRPANIDINAPGQTISLAASLLESAEVLAPSHPELAAAMRTRAETYIEGFLAAPHDLERGVYAIESRRSDNSLVTAMPVWGSVYSIWPAAYIALLCLCAHRLTADERLYAWAESAGRRYATEPLPGDVAVPAMDAGLALGLLADLYDISRRKEWLESAMSLAERLSSAYFDDSPLPRGATAIDWYESQMGPGFLLHGIARTAMLAAGADACPLDADYTAR